MGRQDLTQRVHLGLSDHLANSALSRVASNFLKNNLTGQTEQRRIVLLDLNNGEESKFWQIIHNTPERFKVISSKESHQNSGYMCRLIFEEIGEGLPVYKSREDLIKEYLHGE